MILYYLLNYANSYYLLILYYLANNPVVANVCLILQNDHKLHLEKEQIYLLF